MVKLNLDQFLRKGLLTKSKPYTMIDSASVLDEDIKKFLDTLSTYNEYEIESTPYDSFIFTGNDNIYFSYGFNTNTGTALHEALFILSATKITKVSDNVYILTESSGKEYTLRMIE